MRTNVPTLIEASNLSVLWAKAFLHVMEPRHAAPLVLTVDGFDDSVAREDTQFRAIVDQALDTQGKVCVEDNAYMIFPERLWQRHGRCDRQWLYDRYDRLLPRLMRRDRKNCYGTYFGRLIGWTGSRGQMQRGTKQLEHIITIWHRYRDRGTHPRISEMQASCFSPQHDLRGQPQRGFPCLHQIGFSYDDDGLVVSALYPTQYVFDRGYGNYLGLCHLGRFMAEQMNMSLERLTCFVIAPALGVVGKRSLEALAQTARGLITIECPQELQPAKEVVHGE